MRDRQFDDVLKDKLDSISADRADSNWARLNERIQSRIEDSAFDDSIVQKFSENLTVPGKSDWDTFSQMLSHSESFDSDVKQKLQNLQGNNVSEHWLILHDKLKHILYLKEAILSLKIIESLLATSLLLIFVTLLPFVNNQRIAMNDVSSTSGITEASNKLLPEKNFALSSIESNLRVNNNTSRIEDPIAKPTLGDLRVAGSIEVRKNTTKSTFVDSSLISDHGFIVSRDSNDFDNAEVVSLVTNESDLSQQAIPANVNNRDKVTNIPILPMVTNFVIEEASHIASFGMAIDMIGMDIFNNSTEPKFALHLVSGLSLDQIFTPEDEIFELESYNHVSLGSSVGGRISYDLGKLSLETGLSILYKGYKPLVHTLQSIETINFKLASIPLIAKYDIGQLFDSQIFGVTGLQYSQLTSESFTLDDRILRLGNGDNYLQKKILARSLNEDFVHYSLGIGARRSLTETIQIYGQVLYTDQLSRSGVGLNHDVINSTNLQFGIKFYPSR